MVLYDALFPDYEDVGDSGKTVTSANNASIEDPQRRRSGEPTGYLMYRFSLCFFGAVLLLAVWFGQGAIVALCSLILALAGIALAWSKMSLLGVHIHVGVSDQRVFPGEETELRLRVLNRKPLPVPWLDVVLVLPRSGTPSSGDPAVETLHHSSSFLWYQSQRVRRPLYFERRGYYRIGPLTVSAGDMFGLYPRSERLPWVDHVIVYPRMFSITDLGIPPLDPTGNARAERFLFQDPSCIVGVREYQPYDSLRHIHWKASARRRDVHVKVFEPTTTWKVVVCLAIDSFPGSVDGDPEFELAVSAAASVARHVLDQGSPAGLWVNTKLADSGYPVRLGAGAGEEQLGNILESLAKTTSRVSAPFGDFLDTHQNELPWGTTQMLIIGEVPHDLKRRLVSFREAGHRVVVLVVGDHRTEEIEDVVECHKVRTPSYSEEKRS